MKLEDGLGRTFSYLRLSITDKCNFRCRYCLPNGHGKTLGDGFLTSSEIARLAKAMAGLGVWKIRLTGGEPSVRRDFPDIISALASTTGVRKISATTNGYSLAANAARWRSCGLSSVNVSVDSLKSERFREITGHDKLDKVLDGVRAAASSGMNVKINAVLLKGVNDDEMESFIAWAAIAPVSVRFIELMQTGDNAEYFRRHHLSADALISHLLSSGWQERPRREGDGPAAVYCHPRAAGQVGVIAPYSRDFCASCNRLRVTARGDLRLCLFGDSSHSLRDLLQNDDQTAKLQERICGLLRIKKPSHYLRDGITGMTSHLASLGG